MQLIPGSRTTVTRKKKLSSIYHLARLVIVDMNTFNTILFVQTKI